MTILARATQSLSRFNLDFGGDSVGSVSVDGRTAAFRREDEELVITPRRPIDRHETFLVRVAHFVATPTAAGDEPESAAFFSHATGSATAPQPYFAHLIYPSNDHPRDKASFSFRFDVPAGAEAVANGVPLGRWTSHGRTTWAYVRAFEQLEREWVRRHRDGVVRTADFIALASKVAHRDLSGFLRAWVYGETTPAMPGHPDWTVDPVEEQATARALARAPARRR